MADPRFYTVAGPLPLGKLAGIAEAEIIGNGDPGKQISDVAPLQTAGSEHISFFDNNKVYREAFAETGAGACIVGRGVETPTGGGMALLAVDDPHRGYALVAHAFYPAMDANMEPQAEPVDATAKLGPGVAIGRGAVIGRGARLGANCRIGANAVIGPAVEMGEDCIVGPGATVRYCLAGNRVRIAAGVRIGEDGFGYVSAAKGHLKVPQLGRVLIGDDVEIGANTTVDRGSGPDTTIADGVIIDNLVQIAHNVTIGRNTIIIALVGISGSTTIGDNVVIGGQVGIAGHVTLGDGSKIMAQSGIMADIPPGALFVGTPAVPQRDYWRQTVTLRRLAKRKPSER
ncbi:MAG: UDP-3-O-(3-hydroxymyristoyl)glucosamine N-acyltransferase [Alphaproteobacteria bacterium]|nr:MAG: UDP-3-O-(3-hydroxymyristoyl)glucosamine N-acyltransferase [Alphaproteobacteria bacterium]